MYNKLTKMRIKRDAKKVTLQELKRKYAGKYVDVYPHFYERRVNNKWITVYEIRGVSKIVKENFESVENIGG